MISKPHKNFKQRDVAKKYQPNSTLNHNLIPNYAFVKRKYKYLLKTFYTFKGKTSPVFFSFIKLSNLGSLKAQIRGRSTKFSTNIFFYMRNKHFSKKISTLSSNYSQIVSYSFSLVKATKSFNQSFTVLFNSLNSFNVTTAKLHFTFYFYYLFYCNFLPFLSIKTLNYLNNTTSDVFLPKKNSSYLFFNKNRSVFNNRLTITPHSLFKNLNKFAITPYFLFNLIGKKDISARDICSISIFKKLRVFSFFLKNSYCKYLFFSKSFFINFTRLNSFENKFFNTFKLSSYDWISDSLAKLTKDSIHLNTNSYLLFKSISTHANPLIKLVSTCNSFNTNDSFFENNFFFPFFKDSITPLGSIKESFFKITNPVLSYKLSSHLPSMELLNKDNFINTLNFSPIKNINKFDILVSFFFKPLYFKFLTLNDFSAHNSLNASNFIDDYFFYSLSSNTQSTNILPSNSFFYIFKKKMLKIFNYSKFPTITSIWHYHALIRFLEFCSGKKTYLRFNTFLNSTLNFSEKAQCVIWAQKVKYFRKVLGPRLFLTESLQIIYLALKLKDPYILSNWMVSTMQKISFWKYKTFLRYVKYVLRYFFWIIFRQLGVKGIKFQLKGKISVAGNARTRTVLHTIGFTSHTTYDNKILYKLNLVKTFTGVLGLKLWIVF